MNASREPDTELDRLHAKARTAYTEFSDEEWLIWGHLLMDGMEERKVLCMEKEGPRHLPELDWRAHGRQECENMQKVQQCASVAMMSNCDWEWINSMPKAGIRARGLYRGGGLGRQASALQCPLQVMMASWKNTSNAKSGIIPGVMASCL
jgi:hypothetical protein